MIEVNFQPVKPPEVLHVLHLTFTIEFVSPSVLDRKFAQCDTGLQSIHFAKGLSPALLADAAIHEALHAIHFAASMDDTLTEERIASQFAGPMVCLMRDNPQFFAWLNYLVNQ